MDFAPVACCVSVSAALPGDAVLSSFEGTSRGFDDATSSIAIRFFCVTLELESESIQETRREAAKIKHILDKDARHHDGHGSDRGWRNFTCDQSTICKQEHREHVLPGSSSLLGGAEMTTDIGFPCT